MTALDAPLIAFTDATTIGYDVDFSPLAQLGNFQTFDALMTPEQVLGNCAEVGILITNKTPLKKALLQQLKQLKMVCIAATGYNNIDLEAAKELGIAVANVAGYSTHAVAQRTFSFATCLVEQLPFYDEFVKSGKYSSYPVMSYYERKFWEINDKTWGIIGMGNIGRQVAKIAEAYGAKVLYHSTSGKNTQQDYPALSLKELCQQSDFISIHAPLNAQTQNLIGTEQLQWMKKKAVLINVGRGGIIDEEALAKALNQEQIFGAALDVMAQEPIQADSPLLSLKQPHRLLLSPHNAWASLEARKLLIEEMALNIQAFNAGEQRNRL